MNTTNTNEGHDIMRPMTNTPDAEAAAVIASALSVDELPPVFAQFLNEIDTMLLADWHDYNWESDSVETPEPFPVWLAAEISVAVEESSPLDPDWCDAMKVYALARLEVINAGVEMP